MAEYFAFQAALCFSVAHILVRRGLVNSNALTGSFISLATSAAAFWMLLPWFVPLSALWAPAIIYFVVAGFFAPAVGQTLGYLGIERIGVARSAPIVNSAPIFSSLLAVFFWGKCGCSRISSERVSSSLESSYFLQSGRLEARGASSMLFIQFWGHWPSAYRPPFAKPA